MENAKRAEAIAGICSAWQTWQTVSGPLLCSCRSAPPHAKYNSAAQANSAKTRCSCVPPSLRCKISIAESTTPNQLHINSTTQHRAPLDATRGLLVTHNIWFLAMGYPCQVAPDGPLVIDF